MGDAQRAASRRREPACALGAQRPAPRTSNLCRACRAVASSSWRSGARGTRCAIRLRGSAAAGAPAQSGIATWVGDAQPAAAVGSVRSGHAACGGVTLRPERAAAVSLRRLAATFRRRPRVWKPHSGTALASLAARGGRGGAEMSRSPSSNAPPAVVADHISALQRVARDGHGGVPHRLPALHQRTYRPARAAAGWWGSQRAPPSRIPAPPP